jgi:hypothetical protein
MKDLQKFTRRPLHDGRAQYLERAAKISALLGRGAAAARPITKQEGSSCEQIHRILLDRPIKD